MKSSCCLRHPDGEEVVVYTSLEFRRRGSELEIKTEILIMFLRTKDHIRLDCISGYLLFSGFILILNKRSRKPSNRETHI